MPTRYCILLKDGNYLFGFNPQTQQTTTTHLVALALPFKRHIDAMDFLAEHSKPDNGIAFRLIGNIVPLIGAPVIESA